MLGIEGDFQWTNAGVESCVFSCLDPVTSAGGLLYNQSLSSFGTLRGRLGWTNGPSLVYLTGGAAYGQFDTNLMHTQIGQLSHVREDKWGWTGGGGLETQIAGNVTAKVEYLYLDFGTTTGQGVFVGADQQTYGFSSRLHEHVFRTGLNYKFGDPIYLTSLNAMDTTAAPVAGWTGFYVGGNAGVSLARNPTTYQDVNVQPYVLQASDRVNLDPVGAIVGGQAGYLAKLAPNWLAGVEVDLQSAHLSDPTTCFGNCASNQATGLLYGRPAIALNGVTQRQDWFATFRARAGWTNGNTLYYATGGAALGRVVTDVNMLNANLSPTYLLHSTGSGTIAATKWGWVAGGGIETALSERLSVKGEYLYMDLGEVNGTVLRNNGTAVITVSSQVRNHLFRLGVNYHPDWGSVVGLN